MTFIRATGGNGSADVPYSLTDIYGLQGIDLGGVDSSSFLLGNNIDASGTAAWNDGAGFDPIGEVGLITPFTGNFDGAGYVVSGLSIDRPGQSNVGLFGLVGDGAIIQNVKLFDVNITGGNGVGSLVGRSSGTVENIWATGSVTGSSYFGGLVGDNFGNVARARADVTVQFDPEFDETGDVWVGGLVGRNNPGARISASFASGSVTVNTSSSAQVGGLVGRNQEGEIIDSYATGNVSATTGSDADVGGLIGGEWRRGTPNICHWRSGRRCR